ncbi:MAG: nucleotidyltransferase domain-containing protein [Oligoflexia bacterium]|nr:nucleotidyltransferase domain-containing protein [Oligoflexia bacterium]
MRITSLEGQSIISVLDSFFLDVSSKASSGTKIYLFGSRVDDNKKGGDIDLLIVGDETIINQHIQNKFKILMLIKKKIGERKVDLVFSTHDNSTTDPFVSTILKNAILLKSW